MKKTVALAALATTMSLCMTSCSMGSEGGKMYGEADYETHASVEDLTENSAGAFYVKVGGIVSRECDDGGDAEGHGEEPTVGPEDSEPEASVSPSDPGSPPEGIEGGQAEYDDCLPMVFHEAKIHAIIYQGPAARGIDPVLEESIIIGNVDTSKIELEGASPLVPGSYVVVYGDHLSPAEHPGIKSISEDIWVPVGGDQGILDVEGETVTARSPELRSLMNGEPASRSVTADRFTTDLKSLEKVAEAVS